MIAIRSKTFPLPSSRGLEIDFLENRPSEFQNQARDCIFDASSQQFTPRTTVGTFKDTVFSDVASKDNQIQLKHTHDALQSAIQALKEKKGRKNYQIAKFDISEARSWGDVVTAVKAAEEAYLKDDSPTGKIRKAFRKVEDNAKSIQPFLGMLPDGEYKTLCGGLTLVLKAMMKKAERRQKMAEVFERLPLVFQDAEDYAHIYPGADQLRCCIEGLYIQIIGAIEDMILWYLEKPIKRGFKSVLSNDNYGEKLARRIGDIDVAQSAFKGETEKLLHWRTKLIDHNGIVTNMTTQQISVDLKQVDNKVGEIQQGQRTVVQEIALVGSKVVNNVSSVLQDLQKNAKWLQDREEECKKKLVDQAARIKDLENQLQKKTIRANTLASRLHISLPADCYAADIEMALATGITQRVRFQAKAKYIAETDEFRYWFTSRESGFLCINGNSDQDSLSPTAFLASLLVQDMKSKSYDILVLPFFCGLHTTTIEKGEHMPSGPTLLLITLIAQILSLDDTDAKQYLAFLDEDDVQAMESMQTKSYLKALQALITNLLQRYKGIFLIIDGIEFYDKEEHRPRLKRVLKFLEKLTKETSPEEGSLKLLMMASSQCSLFRRSSGIEALDVPEEVDCDGEGYESLGEI